MRTNMHKRQAGLIIVLVLGGMALVGVAVVAVCGGLLYLDNQKIAREKEEKAALVALPTRDEFRAKWMGKTKEEVLAELGQPAWTTDTQGSQNIIWNYGNALGTKYYAIDQIAGKPLPFVRFEISRRLGIVVGVEF